MPREQLAALTADVDRLLAAGASTAAANENLRRRAKTLREMGQKVAALNPVADAIDRVTNAAPSKTAPALLDLVVLTRQIRASLSNAGVAGDLQPLPQSGPWQTPLPVRDVQPLVETLTSSGSGRLTLVQEAAKNSKITDLRLVEPLLDSLSAKYPELANFVAEKMLPKFGSSVLLDLRTRLDQCSPSARPRFQAAISRIDPQACEELCRAALEDKDWKGAIQYGWQLPSRLRFDILAPFCDELSNRKKASRELGSQVLALFEEELERDQQRTDWDPRWANLLLPHLTGPSREFVARALQVVMGPKAIPHLLPHLRDSVHADECMLVHALGDLRARKAVPALVELMPVQQGHHDCIHSALRTIADPAAIPLLKKLSKQTKYASRRGKIDELIQDLETPVSAQ